MWHISHTKITTKKTIYFKKKKKKKSKKWNISANETNLHTGIHKQTLTHTHTHTPRTSVSVMMKMKGGKRRWKSRNDKLSKNISLKLKYVCIYTKKYLRLFHNFSYQIFDKEF